MQAAPLPKSAETLYDELRALNICRNCPDFPHCHLLEHGHEETCIKVIKGMTLR